MNGKSHLCKYKSSVIHAHYSSQSLHTAAATEAKGSTVRSSPYGQQTNIFWHWMFWDQLHWSICPTPGMKLTCSLWKSKVCVSYCLALDQLVVAAMTGGI